MIYANIPFVSPHVSSILWFLADGSELELIHPGLTNVIGGRCAAEKVATAPSEITTFLISFLPMKTAADAYMKHENK